MLVFFSYNMFWNNLELRLSGIRICSGVLAGTTPDSSERLLMIFHSLKVLWPLSQKTISPAFDWKDWSHSEFGHLPVLFPHSPLTTSNKFGMAFTQPFLSPLTWRKKVMSRARVVDSARLWSQRVLGVNLDYCTYQLCDLPQVTSPLSASLLFFTQKMGV